MIQIQLQRHDPQANFEGSASAGRSEPLEPFGKDGLTFGDLVDVINPLQHIPVVGALYRKLTGDTIDPAIKVAGGALFGGPIGAAASLVAVAIGEARKDTTVDAAEPERNVADHVVNQADDPVPPGFLIATSHTDSPRPSSETDAASGRESSKSRSDGGREIRRGGWMVVQAYGPVPADSSDDHQSKRVGRVDLAV